jgi:hypothetical protein
LRNALRSAANTTGTSDFGAATAGLAKRKLQTLCPAGEHKRRRAPHERPNETAGAGVAEVA